MELPAALSISSWSGQDAQTFARSLKNSLLDLQRAYPRLLDEIEAQVRNTFDLHGTAEEVRQRLRVRATPLVNHTADRTLSLLVREASYAGLGDWRETLGRVVNNGQPPSQWRDADAIAFQARIRQLASDFVRLEELVAEQRQSGASHILRIGLLDGYVQELREVVSVTPARAPLVDSLSERIARLLEEETDQSEESRRVRLAALAQAAARYLQTSEVNNDG
jgi:hypothetical protein